MNLLEIKNDGPIIVATNYWSTEVAQAGYAYLSVNAGAFRLLLPNSLAGDVDDMLTAEYVIVTRGTWYTPHDRPRKDAVEILFEDGTDEPYCLHMVSQQVDRLPTDADEGRTDLRCLVYTVEPNTGLPILEMNRPARYRRVKRLPYMKPWGDDRE